MSTSRFSTVDSESDVVICGGGLAGLLLARHLRRDHPELSVTVIERTRRPLPDACHKVGESSVELASQYLEQLGLTDYLRERHLLKFGLRFFPGGGDLPLHQRTEIGASAEPIVRSYQLDRGRFEGDLRGFVEADGVRLIEGAKVTRIDCRPGEEDHRVEFALDGGPREIFARWVVDATGRSALIRRGLKMTRGARHAASAAWFRVAGLLDINSMVPESEVEWHTRPSAAERWRSTNHLMGTGYWAWLIPLSTGHTSVGLVIHEDVHDHRNIAGLDRMLDFLRTHEPYLAALLEPAEIKDFLCLRNYAHTVGRAWSADRWALVGEAGAFVDPLYSPGSDYIALANSFTVEMIRADLANEDLEAKAALLNGQYRALVAGALVLYRTASPVFGHPSAMAAKVYWDDLAYWSFTCHFFQQGLHRLSESEYAPFGSVGRRFLALTGYVQALLSGWARRSVERPDGSFRPVPVFPSLLVDCHIHVARKMTFAETLGYVRMRLEQAEQVLGEIVLRVVQELGPEHGRDLLEEAGFASWGVDIPDARLQLELLSPDDRSVALPELARDVERTLGPVRRHPDAVASLGILAQTSSIPPGADLLERES